MPHTSQPGIENSILTFLSPCLRPSKQRNGIAKATPFPENNYNIDLLICL